MNGSTTELDGFLAASRALWRRRTIARGAIWGVVAGSCAVVVLFGAAWSGLLPTGLQPWLRWIPLALTAALLLLGVLRALVRSPDDRVLALRAEEAVPDLQHLPTTLLDLPADHPYAPPLARRVADTLRGVRPQSLFDPVSSRGSAVGGVLIAVFALVALTTSGGPTAVWAAWGEPGGYGLRPDAGSSALAPRRSESLADLTVRVVPPEYTGLPETRMPLDGVVTAIAGSHVELSGTGGGPGLDIALVRGEGARTSLPFRRDEARWAFGWTLEAGDRGLVLTDDEGRERVVPLSAQDDPPPTVELLEPDRDFVLATGSGDMTFHARARDPLGVADFRLTWVHTRGSGESFDFREGVASWTRRERTADGVEGRLVLSLDDLELGPGDVLHLRAVATDDNDVTGPGTGVSETRQIRIIREGEEMSVDALVGFPLELDQQPVLSQRMILLMTEDLLAREADLTASAFRAEAEAIADEQTRLRTQVADQIYSRATGAMETLDTHLGHEGLSPVAEADTHAHDAPPPPEPSGSRYGVASIFDPTSDEPGPAGTEPAPAPVGSTENPDPAGTQVGSYEVGGAGRLPTGFGQLDDLGHDHDSDPVLSVNRPLLAIHDAMWASEGELRVIRPAASLPHQRLALERLQSLRESERVFPRGQVTVPPVDVEGARGTGEVDEADPASRSPWSGERVAARWLARLEGALTELAEVADQAEADSVEAAPDGRPGAAASAPTLQRNLERLAVELVADPRVEPAVVASVAGASDRLREGDTRGARTELLAARALLDERTDGVASDPQGSWPSSPSSVFGAATDPGVDGTSPAERSMTESSAEPFVFATLRYESGNWDSAPLVPQNLIHTLAQYTALPVAPEGVVVDLSSSEIFRYPVLYLTGHLPVRFSGEESRNLEEYVERGGFVFMDDHNHDIDGAFHRTATAELERIFGGLEALPADHELYRAFFQFEDGPPITAHELSGWGDGLIHRELFAVVRNGRIGVLYSNKDYSSEWSYHAVNKRFLAVDNTRFGVNILLYALTR